MVLMTTKLMSRAKSRRYVITTEERLQGRFDSAPFSNGDIARKHQNKKMKVLFFLGCLLFVLSEGGESLFGKGGKK